MQTLQERVRELIIDIPNFPVEGIIFKDILPLFRNATLIKELVLEMAKELRTHNPTALVAMESRGFLLGMPLALELGIPFINIKRSRCTS
jgi:adenine phosphoribosyltransferase